MAARTLEYRRKIEKRMIADFDRKTAVVVDPPPWIAGERLAPSMFAAVRRRALLEFCKWDPQVGDVAVLADFPLILRTGVWRELAALAEQLTRETLAAEQEVVARPELLDELGLPRPIRRVLRRASCRGVTPPAARAMRFDFHFTAEGWCISEVNSDAPGGFSESSSFTEMMAGHCCDAVPAGDPGARWCDAIAHSAGSTGTVALLSAPGFMEDHQVVAYAAAGLRQRGCTAHLAGPRHIEWRGGRAFLNSAWHCGPLDALVRFYQSEWLVNRPRSAGWPFFFCGGHTPIGNPGVAIISESKRFPLIWDRLSVPLRAWRHLLPETRDPREAPWRTDDAWLLKTALCNTGDTVSIRALLGAKQWRAVARDAWLRPHRWVAQRRFLPLAIDAPAGPLYPCIGVYTVNGRTAGAYARAAPRPLIDFAAMDVALLVQRRPVNSDPCGDCAEPSHAHFGALFPSGIGRDGLKEAFDAPRELKRDRLA